MEVVDLNEHASEEENKKDEQCRDVLKNFLGTPGKMNGVVVIAFMNDGIAGHEVVAPDSWYELIGAVVELEHLIMGQRDLLVETVPDPTKNEN